MKLQLKDTFKIDNQSNDMQAEALFLVYLPILGSQTIGLYNYLKQCPSLQSLMHEHVSQTLNMPINQVQASLIHLQQFQLIRIFSHENHYIYQLNNPFSLKAFLSHDVFGRIALKHLGSKTFEELRQRNIKGTHRYEEYEELHFPLDKSFMQNWEAHHEAAFNKVVKNPIKDLSFDIKLFLQKCSALVFPMRLRTQETVESIREIGTVYGLTVDRMMELVGKVYVDNHERLDTQALRKLASKETVDVYPEVNHPYELPPNLFLKQLRQNIEPLKLEKYVLQDLVSTYRLSPRVLNVLIEANYHYNQQTLHLKQLETIGLQWSVLNIQTPEEALAQVKKSFKPRRNRRTEEPLKSTIDQEPALSEADTKAIKEALKNIGGR